LRHLHFIYNNNKLLYKTTQMSWDQNS